MVSCQLSERSITGGFGSAAISGSAVMTGALEGVSPSGIAVSIVGTGMTMTLSEDGRFFFAGAPEEATLSFRRITDAIDEAHQVQAGSNLIVSLGKPSSSRKRGTTSRVTQIEGVILQVSATSITVTSSHRVDVVLEINDKTSIRKGKDTLTPADLHIGDRVHVRAELKTELTGIALEIKLQNPEGDDDDKDKDEGGSAAANGTVASLGDRQLVVSTHSGPQITVKITDQTEIKRQGRKISFSEIKVGDRIEAKGTPIDATSISATKINIEPGSNNGHKKP